MRALEERMRACGWISEIREVKRVLAEGEAARARAALDEAKGSRRRAQRAVDLAQAEWTHSISSAKQFDPVFAQLWAHEISARERRLQEVEKTVSEKRGVEGATRATWAREISQSELARTAQRTARHHVIRKREEIRLSDMADVTTQRWQSR